VDEPVAAGPRRHCRAQTKSSDSIDHIRPLFRPMDRNSMLFAFDLWKEADVAAHRQQILARLRAGTMPCDGAWPDEKIALFERWYRIVTPRRCDGSSHFRRSLMGAISGQLPEKKRSSRWQAGALRSRRPLSGEKHDHPALRNRTSHEPGRRPRQHRLSRGRRRRQGRRQRA
jgi:hypothetical protein